MIAGGKPGVCILCDLPDLNDVKELELKSSKWAPDGQGVAYINEQDHGNLQPLNGGPPHALTRFEDAQYLEFGGHLTTSGALRADACPMILPLRGCDDPRAAWQDPDDRRCRSLFTYLRHELLDEEKLVADSDERASFDELVV